ncbi:TPA: helix-turn-helix domain-containing protein [Vibrio parahaemolyticus]|nr:helix-turn-helix domain-containing protein [Vibrio fluvialis]HBC3993249.1 helix-turn-helix domain-containing protein [Vibrio parahaemolyticus]
MTDTSLLRVNDACQIARLSRNTLYRYMKSGALKYMEENGVRLIELSDLEQFMSKSGGLPSVSKDVSFDVSKLHQSINDLTHQISRLCDIMERNSDSVTTSKKAEKRHTVTQSDITSDVTYATDNERRALEAQKKVFEVLDRYAESGEKMPSIRAMAEAAGVERGTFSKHKKTWEFKSAEHLNP